MSNQTDHISGLPEAGSKQVAENLGKVLASSYALYLKTQNYHWNVTGPYFESLHAMFERQYTELATSIDEIAERIRSLGHVAPGTFSEFQNLSSVSDETGVPDSNQMLTNLVAARGKVISVARETFAIAENINDETTQDLLTQLLAQHEKAVWMLQSSVAK